MKKLFIIYIILDYFVICLIKTFFLNCFLSNEYDLSNK